MNGFYLIKCATAKINSEIYQLNMLKLKEFMIMKITTGEWIWKRIVMGQKI